MIELMNDFASDSTKSGSQQARSVLNMVYKTEPVLVRLDIEGAARPGERRNLSEQEANVESKKISTPNQLRIFPNPTDHGFTIFYNSQDQEQIRYCIKDLLGKQLACGDILSNIEHKIDAHLLTNGVYFVTLMKGESLLETRKLIIMK